jgi:NAD(P)-dependent dehydrogenase (short-subunit alcohol dehydrogenase family)
MTDASLRAAYPAGGLALVVGATGGIGGAFVTALHASGAFARVLAFSRSSAPALDLTDEGTIRLAAKAVADTGLTLRLVIDATGFLHGSGFEPEKALRQFDPTHAAHAFAINAIGPAMLMKHFLPLLPRAGRSAFVTLSAKVGSIGDNSLGGWYSYRASKAALNQFVKTAAIELARNKPDAVCLAMHPGTVASGLSQPFAKAGLDVRPPDVAVDQMLAVIARLTPADTGGFLDYRGDRLPW